MMKSNKPTEARKSLQKNGFKHTGKILRKWWVNIPRHFFDHAILCMFLLWISKNLLSLISWSSFSFSHRNFGVTVLSAAVFSSGAIAIVPIVYAFRRGRNRFLQTVKFYHNMRYLELSPKYRSTASEGTPYEQYRNLLTQYHATVRKEKDLLGAWLCSLIPALLMVKRASIVIQRLTENRYQVLLTILNSICAYVIILAFFYLLLKIGRIIRRSGGYLRKLTEIFHLTMIPDHTDGCAGLSRLGNLCAALLWPVIFGLGIAITYIGFAFYAQYHHLYFLGPSIALYLMISILMLVVYVVPTLIWGIILPVQAIHKQMQRQKEQSLVNEDELIQQLYRARVDAIQKEDWMMAKQQQQDAESIKGLYSPIPTWPFKFFIILKVIIMFTFNTFITAIPGIIGIIIGKLI